MILIVDDDQAVRMSITLALTRAGMECEAVSNESDALALVRQPEVELVVLDMNLTLSTTGNQGMEMLRKIRILRPELPVILLTAWGTIPMAVEAMERGAADYITKPWSNQDLTAKIRKALRHAAEEASRASQHDTLETMERKAIEDALRRCDGNLSMAAQQLGITRQALYRRLSRLGIEI